jgi:hypothetical protein
VHGGGTIAHLRDAVFMGLPLGGQNHSNSSNPAAIQEVNVQREGP